VYYVIIVITYCVIFCADERKLGIAYNSTSAANIETIWTSLPALIASVTVIPIAILIGNLENTSERHNIGIRSQWYWSFQRKRIEFNGDYLSSLIVRQTNYITSTDVIHDLGFSNLGIKLDANPGRISFLERVDLDRDLNYRNCSELCRVNHSYIPIIIY